MGKYDSFMQAVASDEKPGKYAGFMDAVSKMDTAMPANEPPARDVGSPGLLGTVLKPLGWVGEQVARVSTSPLIGGFAEVQKSRQERGGRTEGLGKFTDPQEYADVGRFVGGALKNFGKTPEQVGTTSKQVAEGYGVTPKKISEVLGEGMFRPLKNNFGEVSKEPMRGGFAGVGGALDPSVSGLTGGAAELATPIPGIGQAGSVLRMTGKAGAKTAKVGAEVAAKTADVVTGTKAGTNALDASKAAIEGLGKSYQETTEGLKSIFGAKQASDFEESVKTAMKNGVDPNLLPEAVEFGPHSIITRSARVKAEGPLGQPILEKFDQGKKQVENAIVRDIDRIGGGQIPTPQAAGDILREGFNSGVKKAFDDIEVSHSEILKEVPGLTITPNQSAVLAPKLEKMEAWANAKMASALTKTAKAQAEQVLNAVSQFKKKGTSYSGAYDALREIGEVAYKKTPNSLIEAPPDLQKFRQLYGDINEAMINTVDETMPAGTAKSLRDANASMSKIYGDKGILSRLGEKNAASEDLFKEVIQGGNSKEIAALKPYLTPEQLQALKGAALHDIIKFDPDGRFTFRATHNALRNKADVYSTLFEPGELDNIESLIRLGDKFGSAVMSTSGTGASNAFLQTMKSAKDNAVDAMIVEPKKQQARLRGFDVSNPVKPSSVPGMGLSGAIKSPLTSSLRLRGSRFYAGQEEENR